MQFMDLTKYMYTNAEKDKVPLRAEIDYIRQYIELQKNRMNDRTHVHFSVEKRNERPDAAIAPMILITFVENALKYGVSSHVRSDIFIGLAFDGDWRILRPAIRSSCVRPPRRAASASSTAASGSTCFIPAAIHSKSGNKRTNTA